MTLTSARTGRPLVVQSTDSVLLTDYAGFVRRNVRLLLASTLTAALVVAGLLALLPKTYSSRAVVMVGSSPLGVPFLAGESTRPISVDTAAQIVTSGRVTEPVGRRLGLPAAEVRSALEVTAAPGSRVLRIDFTGASPEQAQRGAQATAEVFLRVRGELLEAQRERQVDSLVLQLQDVQADAAAARSILGNRDVPQSARTSARKRLVELRDVTADVQTRLAYASTVIPDVGEVVREAVARRQPTGPARSVPVTSAAGLGLLAGVLLARRRGREGGRVRSPVDLVDAGILPPVGRVLLDPDAPRVAPLPARARLHPIAGLTTVVEVEHPGTGLAVATGYATGLAANGHPTLLVLAAPVPAAWAAVLGPFPAIDLLDTLHERPSGAADIEDALVAPDGAVMLRVARLGRDAAVTEDSPLPAAALARLWQRFTHVVVWAGAPTSLLAPGLAARSQRTVLAVPAGAASADVREALQTLRPVGAEPVAVLVHRRPWSGLARQLASWRSGAAEAPHRARSRA